MIYLNTQLTQFWVSACARIRVSLYSDYENPADIEQLTMDR